jgi:hypothetical protein
MSTLDTTLQAPAGRGRPARPSANLSAAPLARLLCAVALASAAAGGVATLALARALGAMEPLRPPAAAEATPLPAANPLPSLPAVHDVLRDRAEPPVEPPPAS